MNLEIKIDEPGTLSNRMPSEIRDKIISLKISGSIDRKDFDNVLDEMCDSWGEYDEDDNYTIDLKESPALRTLDLGEATFVGGDQLPYFGFHSQLEKLVLPNGISSILAYIIHRGSSTNMAMAGHRGNA